MKRNWALRTGARHRAQGSEFQALSHELCALCLKSVFGFQPSNSDPSGFAAETDADIVAVDDDGNFAGPVGKFQHGIQLVGIGNDIMILYRFAFLFICFTSSVGVRSGIFSINQNFFRHAGVPPFGAKCKRLNLYLAYLTRCYIINDCS